MFNARDAYARGRTPATNSRLNFLIFYPDVEILRSARLSILHDRVATHDQIANLKVVQEL